MIDARQWGWRWVMFALASAYFFLITAATFSSLGVVLPYMIESLGWTWPQGGAGFSVLALMVGLTGALPAWTLQRHGVKATYVVGGSVMMAGFLLQATTHGLYQYFLGAGLMGAGFALCATVPGIHVLTHWFTDRRSIVIGAYMTIGGLGAVAGPLIVTRVVAATAQTWRLHWWTLTGAMLVLTLLATAFLRPAPPRSPAAPAATTAAAGDRNGEPVFQTAADWRFRDVVRTPQYYVIVAALTLTLLCTLTMNSWAFTHMTGMGVSAALAALALSANGLTNAASRAVGGVLGTRIDPKWLLVAALGGEAVGMLALSLADNPIALGVFAIGEGFGFGMCFFATTMLVVNYFGTRDNPIVLGAMNTISTAAMVGPILAGYIAERYGGFATVFRVYCGALVIMLVVTALMRPPRAPVPNPG